LNKPLVALLGALLILLAGCAPRPPAPSLSQSQQLLAWQQHSQQLAELSHWRFNGRIAIFNGNDRQAGRLSWQQRADHSQITISSVFGTTLLRVNYRPTHTEVIDEQGQRYDGADGEALILRLTGWRLPLGYMADWVKGLPAGADYELDGSGWLAQLSAQPPAGSNQPGWEIHYDSLRPAAPRLPEAMTIESGQLRIKLAINQWQLTTGGNLR